MTGHAQSGRSILPGAGFGMIEVLVALVVVGIAMFGTAKLQALSIGATHNSATRSMIALQAASLGAAMRANEKYWSSSAVPTVVSSFAAGTTTLDSTLSSPATNCTTTTCTPVQLAAYDVQQWLTSLANITPTSGANISCAAATNLNPVTCTIEVDWTEKAISASATTQAGTTPTVFKYQLLVMP